MAMRVTHTSRHRALTMMTKKSRLVDCCSKMETGVRSIITIATVAFSKEPMQAKVAVAKVEAQDLPVAQKFRKRSTKPPRKQ